MRPFCLVESRSQGGAENAGVLSVFLTTILYYHHQLFIDIALCPLTMFHCLIYLLRLTCIITVQACAKDL